MRRAAWIGILFSAIFGLDGMLAGQVMLERGLGAARANRVASPMRATGKNVSGMVDNADKTMKASPESAPGGSQGGSPTAAPLPPVMYVTMYSPGASMSNPAYEDPQAIRVGMTSEELLRRFGPPAIEVSGSTRRTVTYFGKDGPFQLDVQGEKVVLINATKPRPSTISLPGL